MYVIQAAFTLSTIKSSDVASFCFRGLPFVCCANHYEGNLLHVVFWILERFKYNLSVQSASKSLWIASSERKPNIPTAWVRRLIFEFPVCTISICKQHSAVRFSRLRSQTACKFNVFSNYAVCILLTLTVHFLYFWEQENNLESRNRCWQCTADRVN